MTTGRFNVTAMRMGAKDRWLHVASTVTGQIWRVERETYFQCHKNALPGEGISGHTRYAVFECKPHREPRLVGPAPNWKALFQLLREADTALEVLLKAEREQFGVHKEMELHEGTE